MQHENLNFFESLIQSPCNALPITASRRYREGVHIRLLNVGFHVFGRVLFMIKSRAGTNGYKTRKNEQIGRFVVFGILMQFSFILVQLDSGQFQENSQEYVR